jgi:hypothetical protein
MAGIPSHPFWVKQAQALELLMSEHGSAVVSVRPGDTSMVPHLRGGDAVLAVPFSSPAVPGDLLLFRQEDYWVVHRCLGRAAAREGRRDLRMRGDGRNLLDPRVADEDVLARIVAIRRSGAWRSLLGTRARIYSRLMAGHDLCWAAAGWLARTFGLGRVAAALDLGVLRLVVPLAFPAFHRPMTPPDAGSAADAV